MVYLYIAHVLIIYSCIHYFYLLLVHLNYIIRTLESFNNKCSLIQGNGNTS